MQIPKPNLPGGLLCGSTAEAWMGFNGLYRVIERVHPCRIKISHLKFIGFMRPLSPTPSGSPNKISCHPFVLCAMAGPHWLAIATLEDTTQNNTVCDAHFPNPKITFLPQEPLGKRGCHQAVRVLLCSLGFTCAVPGTFFSAAQTCGA